MKLFYRVITSIKQRKALAKRITHTHYTLHITHYTIKHLKIHRGLLSPQSVGTCMRWGMEYFKRSYLNFILN